MEPDHPAYCFLLLRSGNFEQPTELCILYPFGIWKIITEIFFRKFIDIIHSGHLSVGPSPWGATTVTMDDLSTALSPSVILPLVRENPEVFKLGAIRMLN